MAKEVVPQIGAEAEAEMDNKIVGAAEIVTAEEGVAEIVMTEPTINMTHNNQIHKQMNQSRVSQ